MLFTFETCYLDERCVFLQDRSIAIHHFRLQREQECVVSAYPPNYDCLKEINQYVIGTAPSFCITFQQKFISTKVKHCIHMSYPTVLQDSNQMVFSTTVILKSLMYGITSMKEAQLMFSIFTSSVHNLLRVTDVCTDSSGCSTVTTCFYLV